MSASVIPAHRSIAAARDLHGFGCVADMMTVGLGKE